MKPSDFRLPLIIVAWALAVAGVFAAAENIETERTDAQLCVEIQLELDQQVLVGLISQEEADEISLRCFDLFVK